MKHRKNIRYIVVLVIAVCTLCLPINVWASKEVSDLEMAYEILQEKDNYMVGFSAKHVPFTYRSVYGEPAGMAIGIMDKIATKAGINVEYVPVETYEGHIDINLSALVQNQLDYHNKTSIPYIEFPLMAIGNKGFVEKENYTLGCLDYFCFQELEERCKEEQVTLVKYNQYEDMEVDLENGNLDYLIASSLAAADILKNSDEVAKELTSINMNLEIPFTLSQEFSEETLEAFNTVIGSLNKEEAYTIVMNEALNKETNTISIKIWHVYRNEILLTIVILISMIISIKLAYSLKKKRTLLEMAQKDSLTGLYSERGFRDKASEIIQRGTEDYSIVSIDIDNFKYINEVYGYETGTKVLGVVSKHLQDIFTDAEVIGRGFADHFLILVSNKERLIGNGKTVCGKEGCEDCTKHILDKILGENYKFNMSIGVYNIEDKTKSFSYMIDCANIARSRGKSTYGRTHVIFTKEIEMEIQKKNNIVSNMEKGIENKEFRMMYQPKIDLQTSQIIGMEALVRWYKEDGTQVYPDSFIPIFEKNGFIVSLDYYVFDQVCEFIKENENLPRISINLSGVTLLDPLLIRKILRILEKHHVDPQKVEIEITESAIVANFKTAIEKIKELKEAGFSISMDDFGTGVSSLDRLKDIDIDFLKIDKQFLSGDVIDERGKAIIENIIRMAKKLGIKVVAEGVETKEQVEMLQMLNCNIAQGYYYYRPLEIEKIIALAKKYN